MRAPSSVIATAGAASRDRTMFRRREGSALEVGVVVEAGEAVVAVVRMDKTQCSV